MAKVDFENGNIFEFDDSFFSLMAINGYDSKMIAQTRAAFDDTRNFCRNYLAPMVLKVDRDNAADHSHISWDMLQLAGKHGQLTNFIPPMLGGTAEGTPAVMGPVMEEQAAVDTAYCGMLGGHGLGLVAVMMTLNMRIFQLIAERTAAAAKSEKPYVIDCAITEPTAGTDVEEVELYPKAKLMSQAKRVPGGAVLNGRKCFISTGHMATDHVILMPFDLKDPIKNYGCFLVPGNSEGFSLGRKERKMGHRASAISELIFEDCFVPTENIIMDTKEFIGSGSDAQFELLLELVLGITRVAVGAMGTGCARGSFERCLALAQENKYKGETILKQQWAQNILTNMYMNVMMARAIYMEGTFANMVHMPGGLLSKSMPGITKTQFMKDLFRKDWFKKAMHSDWLRKRMISGLFSMDQDSRAKIQYMASMAKVVGSDMAMENAHLAVEFMGRAGIRHDQGIEKRFRDAKLLQIFEGTNQLNRLNIFKHRVARHYPGVEVFQ